jgi:hypothetical protein
MKTIFVLFLFFLSWTWCSPVKDTIPVVQDSASLRYVSQEALKAPEYLLFDIDWGFINAGQASLEILPMPEQSNLWQIRSLAWCNAFFQTFYPVQDTIVSVIDKNGLYPVRFEKNIHEGTYHANVRSFFDQEKHKGWLQDTVIDIAPFTHDVLSAFYYIRTKNLEVGKTYELDAVSGKKAYKLAVLCHKKERIKVPAGRFNTIVVEPKIQGNGLFQTAGKGKLLIWLTDDERRMPVQMKVKIPVGSITASLVKHKLQQ